MSFPAYGFTPKVDSVDTIMAADVNDLQDAVQEIADIVDALPSGGCCRPVINLTVIIKKLVFCVKPERMEK
jgi:hypothetical protein